MAQQRRCYYHLCQLGLELSSKEGMFMTVTQFWLIFIMIFYDDGATLNGNKNVNITATPDYVGDQVASIP